MATEVKRRRGTTVEHSTFTGAVAELTVDLTKDTVVVHDGATQGGFPLLREDFSNVPTTAPFTHITLDTAIFDTTYTETGSETQGTLYWNSDEETLSLVTNGESFELGQKTEIHVKNQTGAQINKGEVVYASGTLGNSGRILITKMIANGTVPAKRIMGITAENIANGADGKIITFGKLKKINTSSFSDGDILYVSASTAGALQNTEPSQASGHVSLPIGYVIHAHSNGQIFIRVTPIDENEYQDYDAQLTTLSGLSADQAQDLVDITASEYTQLQNINSVTISNTQWGYLGALDQALATGDSPTFGGLTVNGSITVTGNVDGRDISADGADLDELYTTIGLSALTSAEVDQLENIGSVTVSNTQWGYLGALDQNLTTTSDVQFDDITSTGIIYTDNIDTVSIVWNVSTQVWDATPSEYFNNPVFIGTSLDVDNALLVDDFVEVGTDLDVGGNTTLLGTLNVSGNTTLGGSLTLSGSADFNSTMNLQGNLTTQANLADDGFSEGWAGTNWKINADGSAEFEEMRIRGALRVYEFIAKQISTIGGSEILSIAQGRVSSVNVGADTITVENVTGTPGNAFKANDLWICQVVDINNDLESGGTGSIVKSVRGTVTSVSGNDIVVTIDAGDITQLEQGDLIIAYGNTSDADRQAIMYRNVDRSEDNLIMRLQTGITEFANLQAVGNTRVAFGDLNGYSGLSAETFGFFAGKNAEQHVLVTDSGIFFKNGSTVGAQLSSNIFKIGDNTNFLSFNTLNSNFEIKVDTFDLNTSFIQIADSISKTSSALTSSVAYSGDLSLDGLFFDEDNYFGYLTDVEAVESNGYAFRVGGNTSNFMELNTANGISKINFNTFTLDATDASGGIKIDSANELIQLEDANRVRTQVDVNNGTFSLTETVKYNADDETLILQSTPYETGSIQITKGDSFYVDIEAELITFGSLGDGDEAYITVEVYGGTTSGSQTNLITSYIADLLDTVGQRNIVRFSAHSYSYEYINVKITVNSNDGDLNGQFRLKENVVVKSYNSQTRVSLDGVYVNSSDNQYARLTRSANELVGILKLSGLPTKKPQTTGVVYNDNGTLKIS